MKFRNILIFIGFICVTLSCRVNDIAFYEDGPRIEFGSPVSCTFDDEDYLNENILGNDVWAEREFTAQLIGYLLESSLTYAVTTRPVASAFTPELSFNNPYSFAVGAAQTASAFSIRCPGRDAVSTRTSTYTGQIDIVYDNASAHQQFAPGRVENLSCRVNVVLQIYPSDWNSSFWGTYSTSKYIFMMETFKAVHSDIEQTTDTKLAILSAYNSYVPANGPLYGDDENSAVEIAFPV